jgi:hypothetical protein
MKNWTREKTYGIVRMEIRGDSMSVPIRLPDGGYSMRKLRYEVIDWGGKKYRCAYDHFAKVIYIDTHAMEEAVESSS